MQSSRRNMMSANLTAEESTSLKTNQDLKIPTGHKLTDLHDGNIHITGWPELFLASDEFPDLVVSQAVQDAIAKGDIKMHHADLDIMYLYNQPVGCIGDQTLPSMQLVEGSKLVGFPEGMHVNTNVAPEYDKEQIEALQGSVEQTVLSSPHLIVLDLNNTASAKNEELIQTTRQKVPPTEYVTVSGPKHEYANQLLKLAETAHVDIPETREERRSRLLTENSVSGAIVKPQNKPLFNKVTHQQMTEDTTTVKKIKNASLSGAYQNLATEQYRDQVTFSEDVQKPIEGGQGSLTGICRAAHQAALETIADSKDSTEEKEMLTAEKAIKILSHSVSTGSNLNVLIIHSILGKLTQEDRDKVSAYFSNNLEFVKPFPETFYPQLISSQRIAEQNNPDHKSVNDFNNRMLMSKQPDIDKCLDQFKKETFLMDSFSTYKPEPMNVKEKLSSLPGYAHSNEQLAEDIKEGNVIMSTIHMTNFIAVTPEGELIPNELDPEDYLKVRQVMREMDEVIEKEFKDKEKFLLENSSLPPGMTLEVEEGETPYEWRTTIHIDGKPLGQFQISRSETVIK